MCGIGLCSPLHSRLQCQGRAADSLAVALVEVNRVLVHRRNHAKC